MTRFPLITEGRDKAMHMTIIGYEPAGLTVDPPPPRLIEGGFIFFAWVSSATKIVFLKCFSTKMQFSPTSHYMIHI